jgi:peptide deformylase
MILPVVKYGNPILRKKGALVQKLTPEMKRLIGDMLETMRDARGVGLAAQQVGEALQLTVVDVRDVTDRPSSLVWQGKDVEVAAFMPLVLINPRITPLAEAVEGPEGCLSFPEIFADIPRAETIEVSAMNEEWRPISFRCSGLLARAIQHEADHLNGILFIDRMSTATRRQLKPELEALQMSTKEALQVS